MAEPGQEGTGVFSHFQEIMIADLAFDEIMSLFKYLQHAAATVLRQECIL
jgi:hypothetical protein